MKTATVQSASVTESELKAIRDFFNNNYGSRKECYEAGTVSKATLWAFLNSGRATVKTITAVREFIKAYKPNII